MRRLTESPTTVTLVLVCGVFGCQQLAGLFGLERWLFTLSYPVFARPWTLVTSVYAHGSVSHLLANAVALALAGVVLERSTTSARFHAFFLTVGSLSGATQVVAVAVLGSLVPGVPTGVSVLGASGAIFGLFGYLLASNRLTDTVVAGFGIDTRAQLVLGGVLAAAITLLTANPGVALLAHFTGLVLGLAAGRTHLLDPSGADRPHSVG